MSDQRKIWQEDDVDAIQRCPHDEQNPYSMISNDLIRDENISPNCRWLIIYLLSNKGTWKIKVSQIREHLRNHIGRNKVFKIMNEAIEAGYILREEYTYKNLKRCRYFVSEKPKFKKCFRCPEIRDAEIGDSEIRHNKEEHPKKEHQKKEYSKSSSSLPSSSYENSSSIDDEPGGADKIEDMKKEESEIAVVGDISYTKTNGTKEKISQTEIYRHFLRKNYDTSTLKEAIKRTQTAQGSINNILKYIESICKQIEGFRSNKEVLEKIEKKEEPHKEIKKEETITWAEYEESLKKGES